jgi:hypothetical protein
LMILMMIMRCQIKETNPAPKKILSRSGLPEPRAESAEKNKDRFVPAYISPQAWSPWWNQRCQRFHQKDYDQWALSLNTLFSMYSDLAHFGELLPKEIWYTFGMMCSHLHSVWFSKWFALFEVTNWASLINEINCHLCHSAHYPSVVIWRNWKLTS